MQKKKILSTQWDCSEGSQRVSNFAENFFVLEITEGKKKKKTSVKFQGPPLLVPKGTWEPYRVPLSHYKARFCLPGSQEGGELNKPIN